MWIKMLQQRGAGSSQDAADSKGRQPSHSKGSSSGSSSIASSEGDAHGKNKEREEEERNLLYFDALICHRQANGSDMARGLKLELETKFKKKIWFDMDEKVTLEGMQQGIAGAKCLILLLTDQVLTRSWCRWEIFNALVMEVPIILIHETEGIPWEFEPKYFLKGVPEDWHPFLTEIIAGANSIGYMREKYLRMAMLKEICETIDNPEIRCASHGKRQQLANKLKNMGDNYDAIFRLLESKPTTTKLNSNYYYIPKLKAKEYVKGTRLWIYEIMKKNWLEKKKWTQVFVLLGHAGVGKSVCLADICRRGHLFENGSAFNLLLVSDKQKQHGQNVNNLKKKRKSSILNRVSLSRKRSSTKSNAKETSEKVIDLDFVVVAAHFFKHDDGELRNAKIALQSIATQLVENVPHLEQYTSSTNVDLQNVDLNEAFLKLIAMPLQNMDDNQQSPKRRAFVVLDALDECDSSQRLQLLSILQTKWQDNIPDWLGICVSSRPEDYIPPKLRSHDPTLLNTEDEANLKDMKIYLSRKLKPYFENKQEKKAAVQLVLERSNGHFLYARFIEAELDNLSDDDKKLTFEKVKKMNIFPANLDDYYLEYFGRLLHKALKGDEEKYQSLLSSICVARAPLPIEALETILSSTSKQVKKLLKKMSQLLVVTDESVRFVHKSMSDFLLDDDRCVDEDLAVDEDLGKKAMAKYCEAKYLSSRFAAKEFIYHTCQVGDYKFLEKNLLLDFVKLHKVLVDLRVNHRSFVGDLKEFFLPNTTENQAKLVVRALEKSMNALDWDRREIASQMTGRIADTSHPLLKSIPSDLEYSWLRPIHTSLTPADDPLRVTFQGHSKELLSVAMSTIENLVVTGSDDKTVKLWSQKSGECLRTLTGHTDSVQSVAVDGDLLVSGSRDNAVKVWSMITGECLGTLEGHSDAVNCVAIKNDTIVSGSWDKTIKVWSAKSGECLCTLEGHSEQVTCVALSDDDDDDDDVIVSGSVDTTIRLWSLAGVKNKEERLYLGTLEGETHSRRVSSVAVDGGIIVSGSYDVTVKIWSKTSRKCLRTLEGHSDPIMSVCIRENIIASAADDMTIKIWSIADELDDTSSLLETLHGHTECVSGVSIVGDMIASVSYDKTAKLWSLKSLKGKEAKEIENEERHMGEVQAIALSNDKGDNNDDDVLASGSWDNSIKIWSRSSGKCLKTIVNAHPAAVTGLVFYNDLLISCSQDNTVRAWAWRDGTCLRLWLGHQSIVQCLATDGALIASGAADRKIKLWSFESPTCLKTLEGHYAPITSVAMAGDMIVSGSLDKTVNVWSQKTGQIVHTLKDHSEDLKSVEIRGNLIISKDIFKRVICWNLSNDGGVVVTDCPASVKKAVFFEKMLCHDTGHSFPDDNIVGFTGESGVQIYQLDTKYDRIILFDKAHRFHFLRLEGKNRAFF